MESKVVGFWEENFEDPTGVYPSPFQTGFRSANNVKIKTLSIFDAKGKDVFYATELSILKEGFGT